MRICVAITLDLSKTSKNYSYLKASTGLSSDALFAGHKPKNIPTKTEKVVASNIGNSEIFVVHPANNDNNEAAPDPIKIPRIPPLKVITTDSIKNCIIMSILRAPIAFLNPISFVRSVTETSMMFMIPIPPTTSEIAAIHPKSKLIVLVVLLNIFWISLMSRISKEFSSFA